MRKATGLWLTTVLVFVAMARFAPGACAGSLDSALADRLARTPRADFVSGLVMMREQPNLPAIQRRIAAQGLVSRWRRHQSVVQSARGLAARTQADVLHAIERLQRAGLVRAHQSFWITNMIAVDALPEVFDILQARDDVGTIFENSDLQLREGWSDAEEAGKAPQSLPDNLVCVNVLPAWTAGFHGEGRLVADFDTGADGNHPAFASRWRGAQQGVPWWEAWKDPYTGTTFPYDHAVHGTHTLGIMVGEKPDGTPIGVAPGAQWIAAGILIGYNVQSIIDCYQWATDPDGDPGTIDDVPDVINNSWGTSGNCDQTYWNAIDVVEAAGIVNTIAVDNTGPSPMSVNSPESRAASATANWGVGNVNPHQPGYPITASSGRGPSPCDSVSIKPEVTAPGTQILSTFPNNSYGSLTGTSMACPHTSGAVAILRQVNPDLTVEEVKTALMATAVDKGTAGEDNDYGWGIIDIGAAVSYVQASLPLLPPQDLAHQARGQTVSLTWGPPSKIYAANPLLGYRIYRAPIGEEFPLAPIAELGLSPSPQFDDPDLPYGDYKYVVTAFYPLGESGPTNQVVAALLAPPSPPRDLTASASSDTVRLSWLPPDSVSWNNAVISYRVYRTPVDSLFPTTPIVELPDTVLTYTETGFLVGETNRYAVTAFFANGESPFSNEVLIHIYDPAAAPESAAPGVLAVHVTPNPFEKTTTLRISAVQGRPFSIAIYAPSGARVRTLAEGEVAGGATTTVIWDGRDAAGRPVASGAYFIRIEQADKVLNRRVTLLR